MRGSFVFTGVLLVAIGVGLMLELPGPITLIGLGAGFILWGLLEGGSVFRGRRRD